MKYVDIFDIYTEQLGYTQKVTDLDMSHSSVNEEPEIHRMAILSLWGLLPIDQCGKFWNWYV